MDNHEVIHVYNDIELITLMISWSPTYFFLEKYDNMKKSMPIEMIVHYDHLRVTPKFTNWRSHLCLTLVWLSSIQSWIFTNNNSPSFLPSFLPLIHHLFKQSIDQLIDQRVLSSSPSGRIGLSLGQTWLWCENESKYCAKSSSETSLSLTITSCLWIASERTSFDPS